MKGSRKRRFIAQADMTQISMEQDTANGAGEGVL